VTRKIKVIKSSFQTDTLYARYVTTSFKITKLGGRYTDATEQLHRFQGKKPKNERRKVKSDRKSAYLWNVKANELEEH